MRFDVALAAIAEIEAVAFSIRQGDEIWRNRSAIIYSKFFANIMPGRSFLCMIAVFEEVFHARTVWLEYALVRCSRPGRWRKPPDTVDRIFHANTSHRHPFSRSW